MLAKIIVIVMMFLFSLIKKNTNRFVFHFPSNSFAVSCSEHMLLLNLTNNTSFSSAQPQMASFCGASVILTAAFLTKSQSCEK